MERRANFVKSSSSTTKIQERKSKDPLEIRLEEFVTRFVKEFEAKLISYSLILDGIITKRGKNADAYSKIVGQGLGLALGGAVGLAVGHPGAGAAAGKAVVGTIAKGIGNKVGREHHQQKVTKLSDFIYYFEQNKPEFREMLVRVGLDIFQSFEMQFGRVTGDLGERGAMNQLATDAMNRAIDYISKTSAETTLDRYALILEGVKLGQSKGVPVLNTPVPGRHKGFEIRCKHETKEIKWKSASLYSKVGIVIINKHNTFYYSKKGENNSVKYGFRRCFTCEKWEELEPLYTKTDLHQVNGQFLDYSYSSGIVEKYVQDVCLKLEDERDETLGIERINSLLNESKDEILDKLQILKPIYDQLEMESKILANIESDLKNLNFEKYYSKFNLKMNEILDEISKGNDKTHSKLTKINFSLEELNDKIESINQVNGVIFQNSVWFDVRNELLTFTGREAILDQIERDLDSGPVVICGLGGIGKSELAVKYAHTRYDKADNVIWVNAETEESIAGSIWQLAQALNVNKMDSSGREITVEKLVVPEIYKIILNQKCLLILDNAKTFSDIELLLRWSPDATHSQPKVIITSRNSSEWESGRFPIKIIQLEVFDRFEAINFVKKSLCVNNSSDIDKLIDVLGNFPLALQHAVTNIKITNVNYQKRNKQFTIGNFLEKFEKEPQKLMCGKLPLDMYRQPCSIFIVVSFTFKELETENEVGVKAQLILRMASYMAPENIREEFFHDEIDDEDELIAIMNLLEKYSLAKINEGKLSVHRLVQQAIRFESELEEEVVLRKVLNSLMKRLNDWNNIRFDISHIVSIWDHACNYDKLIDEFVINFSDEYYFYTSFLQTLLQRNRLEVLRKINNRIEISSKPSFKTPFYVELARNWLTVPCLGTILFVAICIRRLIKIS